MYDPKKTKEQIISWIKDYFDQNATPETKAVIGISGGKDSSIAAALCKEALGTDRVLGVLMPDGEQHDIEIAYDICNTLGIPYIEINIKNSRESLYQEIEKAGLRLNNNASSNTPARFRMTTLYAVSAIVGGRVVNTSNLSEDWVGYSTKYGDMAGDFSPLSDLTVTEVKAVGRELGLEPKLRLSTATEALTNLKNDNTGLFPEYEGEWPDWWAYGMAAAPVELSAARNAKRIYAAAKSEIFGKLTNEDKALADETMFNLCMYDEHSFGDWSSVFKPSGFASRGAKAEKYIYVYRGLNAAKSLLEQRGRKLKDVSEEGVYLINPSGSSYKGYMEFPAHCLRGDYTYLENADKQRDTEELLSMAVSKMGNEDAGKFWAEQTLKLVGIE